MLDRARGLGRRQIASTATRFAERLSATTHVQLEYPPNASNEPRWGYGRPANPTLEGLIEAGRESYITRLDGFLDYADDLAAIERHAAGSSHASWVNGYQPGLDSAAIYCLLRELTPRLYMEIGSGHSTSFAARAIRDGGLETRVVSLDPAPRSEIDALCDEVVRAPLESVGLEAFDALAAGDMLFFDGSHRVFMNSDATTFFLDVLPRLPTGVLVGVHDVYLPDDYPPEIAGRYYSEQYLLAAALLGAKSTEIVLPAHYVSRTPELAGHLDSLWERPSLRGVEQHGVAFWFMSA